VFDVLRPKWIIGIGAYAGQQAVLAAEGRRVNIGRILHPSPASPAANRGWASQAARQLREMGVWK
jgi:single-strand selective monofunctional uracil DNA glycosylase